MTEHLKVVLNSTRDSEMLWQMAEEFVRAEVPVEVVQGIRLGRMTAAQGHGWGQRYRCGGQFQEGRVKSSRAANR